MHCARYKVRKHLRRLYGLISTRKSTIELVNKQNGVCAICAMPPRGKNKENKLHVDHDTHYQGGTWAALHAVQPSFGMDGVV